MSKPFLSAAMIYFLFVLFGCSQYAIVGIDPTRYELLRGNRLFVFHVVAIERSTFPTASRFRVVLTQVLPKKNAGSAEAKQLYESDPSLALTGKDDHDICGRARDLTADAPKDAIRWIISLQPLVVAIGRPDPVPRSFLFARLGRILGAPDRVLLGTTLSLVTQEDATEPVWSLYIGDETERASKATGVTEFRSPQRLGKVLTDRAWNDDKPPASTSPPQTRIKTRSALLAG